MATTLTPNHTPQDCIFQLVFDFTNPHGRFESDNAQVRSRVWRFASQGRWEPGQWKEHVGGPWIHGKWKNDDWGKFAGTDTTVATVETGAGSSDASILRGLKPDDRLFILVMALNAPAGLDVELTAIFARADKHLAPHGYCGSPFYDEVSGDMRHRSVFSRRSGDVDGWPPTKATINESSGAATLKAWYLGYRGFPQDDMNIKPNSGGFTFSVAATAIWPSRAGVARKDFTFDPQMDVGGGDAQQ